MINSIDPQRIFALLVIYRWFSLIPPLAALLLDKDWILLPALLVAAGVNTIISLFPKQLNQSLQQRPFFLIIDLLIMIGLVMFTGGWQSPFYLYSLSPLLIAAFFFGVRGALIVSTTFSFLYFGAMLLLANEYALSPDWLLMVTSIVGFYLISGIFGYASNLLTQLSRASAELEQTHRDLEIIHHLTVSLQGAVDIEDVQEMVLAALIDDLGYNRAAIGLVNEEGTAVTGWLGHACNGQFADAAQIHADQVRLDNSGGLIAQAMHDGCSYFTTSGFGVENAWLSDRCGLEACRVMPLFLRDRPLGSLLVDAGDDNLEARLTLLEAIAGQTAVTIGGMQIRINRARETAVQEERIRIAQDLHDSVSQSLFGIVFTLDGSLRLMPDKSEEAIPELERALETAQSVRADIRQSILDLWPSTLSAERFTNDLRAYAIDVCNMDNVSLEFDIRGEFSSLSPGTRRSLYRMSQEAINNIAQHAAAKEARICLDIESGRVKLVIRDDGRGFEPTIALNRQYDREHFGLHGIQQRAIALGGECHIFSKPGAGTSIAIDVPE